MSDTVKPDGRITSPADGATIAPGTVTFSAEAWDNAGGSGVRRVSLRVHYNGAWHKLKFDRSAPYTVSWTIPDDLPAQEIQFGIWVMDNAGNVAVYPDGKHIVTYNAPSDTAKPGGAILSPADGSIVGPGSVPLVANAWDDAGGSGVEQVEFWVQYDGRWHLVSRDYTDPYTCPWVIPDGLESQDIEIGIHVMDKAGNVAIDPGGKHTIRYTQSTADTTPPSGEVTQPSDHRTVRSDTVLLAANARDEARGSGVKRVEFWAKYGDEWHRIHDDYDKPYEHTWEIPESLPSQDIEIGIHVVDQAGNWAIEGASGTRTIHYIRPGTNPVPYIHQIWSTGDAFHGNQSCGPSSLGMLLAWYNKLPPREPWGHWKYPEFWSSYSWYVMNPFNGFRDLKAYDGKYDGHCTGQYAGLHGASRYTGRLSDECTGEDICGCYVAGWQQMTSAIHKKRLETDNDSFSGDLTEDSLRNLVGAGKPTLVSTELCGSLHVVLVIGYDNGKFIVSDPYGECENWGYDVTANGREVLYTWKELGIANKANGYRWHVRMSNSLPGWDSSRLFAPTTFEAQELAQVASNNLDQTLLTLSERGYDEGFYSQAVSFDLQDRHLQLPMPTEVAPGFYEVSVKPPRRLAAQKAMPVYGSEISADFGEVGPNAFALGDIDQYGGDNLINALDAGVLLAHWQRNVAAHPEAQMADLNGDGVVDDNDWAILSDNYGKVGEGAAGEIEESSSSTRTSTLILQTETTTYDVGEVFTVSIHLDTAMTTYGTDVVLHYDPEYLEVA
jgi:hypothetical protein